MKTIDTIAELKNHLHAFKTAGKSIGFVPTMGALHDGHLSLVKAAKAHNDLVVVSIFVNPIQFNNADDLKKYPRTIEADSALLQGLCDIIFYPSVEEMYPEKVTKEYHFGSLAQVLEGEFRPGHFNGVAVVVKKLFDIVQADRAYFGKKDFQQLAIIRRLVEIENIPIEVIACNTRREKDGLAMSSRNTRLSKEERKLAPEIFESLNQTKEGLSTKSPKELERQALLKLNKHFKPEYFRIVDGHSLQEIHHWSDTDYPVALVAVFLGEVRLIDNLEL